MDRLWAPWRMTYIKADGAGGGGAAKGPTGCVFCDKQHSTSPSADLVVCQGRRSFVLMNLYPYNNGHLMVAPLAHAGCYEELDAQTLAEMDSLAQRAIRALAKAFRPDGYNVGMNLGSAAGAGIADHLHQHIVPRWRGDANFMPVIGETKVLPDSLENSYRKIMDVWT